MFKNDEGFKKMSDEKKTTRPKLISTTKKMPFTKSYQLPKRVQA